MLHTIICQRVYGSAVGLYFQRILFVQKGRLGSPGKADPSTGAVGVAENACGDDLTEGLQHALQLLLIHGQGQVGDIQVGRVLLLLLQKDIAFEIYCFSSICAFYNAAESSFALKCCVKDAKRTFGLNIIV